VLAKGGGTPCHLPPMSVSLPLKFCIPGNMYVLHVEKVVPFHVMYYPARVNLSCSL
jgi:hypothetical protein